LILHSFGACLASSLCSGPAISYKAKGVNYTHKAVLAEENAINKAQSSELPDIANTQTTSKKVIGTLKPLPTALADCFFKNDFYLKPEGEILNFVLDL
jgi:hypothetical protein